jgi:ABC-type branched-subunit amino acid transport system substrate-binding protein
MKRGALFGGICGLAAAALAITACSSSSSTGSVSPAVTIGSGSAGTSTAHGAPINLAFLTEFSTQGSSGDGWAGIQAAIKYVNAHGGIKGRPLTATECVDNNDPNLAAGCATNTANNSSIIASVDQTTLQGSVVEPVFEHAGLPEVGANAFVAADFDSPVAFATDIGGLGGLGAVAAATDLLHAKKVGFVYVQSPAAATEVALLNSVVMAPRHLPSVTPVGVSPTAGDLSTAVAKADEGSPGAIVLYTGQAQANAFVKAARQQGVTTPIIIFASLETASAVQQQLGGGQDLYFCTSFTHSGPFYDDFVSQWAAAGNSPTLADEFAINGWLSVTMFAQVARTLPTVTRASVLSAFNELNNYSTDGMLPPLSFSKPGTALGGKAPRIVNPTMGLAQYQNGTFVPIAGGKFTNPFVVP